MFDIHQSPLKGNAGYDDRSVVEYCEGLVEAFAESPEGRACRERYHGLGWTHAFLDLALGYLGTTPPEMSKQDVNEVLFELFPCDVCAEAEDAGQIVGELRAFWEYLGREYRLPQAAGIAAKLDQDAERRLERELSDPFNFGVAKSFFMLGTNMGFDMTTEEGSRQFTDAYSAAIQAKWPAYEDPEPPAVEYVRRRIPPEKKKLVVTLSREERKAREKLRRKKLGLAKRRRR